MIHVGKLLQVGFWAALLVAPPYLLAAPPAEQAAEQQPAIAVPVGCVCPEWKKMKEPRTLFEWAVGKEPEEDKDECSAKDNGQDDKKSKANGHKETSNDKKETAKTDRDESKNDKKEPENKDKDESKSDKKEKETEEKKNDESDSDQEDTTTKPTAPVCWYRESLHEHRAKLKREPLESDRPDFTEASSTVGRGIIQLEAGYTYIRDRDIIGTRTGTHSFPEMLFRIGMFADWFELRIGQNFQNQRVTEQQITSSFAGAEDLYLGVKLGLTEQQNVWPELALILQMDVPTGAEAFTAKQVLPGFNFCYGWDVIENCLTLAGSTQLNRQVDDVGHFYAELDQSLSVGYILTPKLGAYTEFFAFFPTGAIDPLVGPEYYFDGGFTYKVTYDFQLDIRAGVGLNRHADDFFAGSGFVIRY